MDETRVFVAYTHGNSSSIALVENNNGSLQRRNLSINDISEKFYFKNDYFANIDLAVLISCSAGDESAGSEAFANRLYNNNGSSQFTGARTVIAFNNPVYYDDSVRWKGLFFSYLSSGNTIKVALENTNEYVTGNKYSNYFGYVPIGDTDRTINP
ncbi:MAG: hypothetical protein PHY15_02715 [Eubacteriales bacterium]|nr:hypothetical protein [Eubacteriales bacterium]MDD4474888.1 hypothetical protein [Eubacteriales bacterium]